MHILINFARDNGNTLRARARVCVCRLCRGRARSEKKKKKEKEIAFVPSEINIITVVKRRLHN